MKLSFQGSQGQVTFFFGNKSSEALERLICVVPPSPQFTFQLGAVPPVLQPKQQTQVRDSYTMHASWMLKLRNACLNNCQQVQACMAATVSASTSSS